MNGASNDSLTICTADGRRYIGLAGLQDDETCEANARMIAAAPDLLDALKRLVNDSMFKDHPDASQMAIDAIAKAEGAEA